MNRPRRIAAILLVRALLPLVVLVALMFWGPLARDPFGATGTLLFTL